MLRVKSSAAPTEAARLNPIDSIRYSLRYSFIAACSLISVFSLLGCSQRSPEEAEGERLATAIIQLSERGTKEVSLKQIGESICFLPEGTIYPPARAEQLFPDFKIEYVELFKSHGVWYIVIGDEQSRTAKVYPVQQTLLSWRVSEDLPPPVSCPAFVKISNQGKAPEIDPTSRR